MKCALGIISIVTLVLMSVTTTRAEEADSSWNSYLEHKYLDEIGYDIAINPCGNTPCVAGVTRTEDFPTTDGAFDVTHNYSPDVFVTKFNSAGSELIYSTFLGGWGADVAHGIAMDDSGNAYVTGQTTSDNFPTTPGSFDDSYNKQSDTFVSKLNVLGTALLYSTYLGGDGSETGYGIDIDESGSAYVTGETASSSFPTTSEAYDTTLNGGRDIFVVKMNPSGNELEYSTFIGGSDNDYGRGIASLDQLGRIFITGNTKSTDFPVTANCIDGTYNGDHDVVVISLDASGGFLDYSTFLGGSHTDMGKDIVVDRFGQACVTGGSKSFDFPTSPGVFDATHNGAADVFVLKLAATGEDLLFSTFLGGEHLDYGESIAIDNGGFTYVTGYTHSDNFPISDGAFDITYYGDGAAFIAKLTPSGRALTYSTFLEGSSKGFGIDVDQYGQAYVTGWTDTHRFPTTPGAFDTTLGGWRGDVFVTKLNNTGSSLVFSTFLGGKWLDVGVSEFPAAAFPASFTLHQNYPNPFNASTEIRYQIPRAERVNLRIYNIRGQTIRNLCDSYQEAGNHMVSWQGRDDNGRDVSSGVYFCRLQAVDFTETVKMVLVR